MPRYYDYTNEGMPQRLETIRYGYNELSQGDMESADRLSTFGRQSQFHMIDSSSTIEEFQEKVEKVFAWLEANTTGAWYWYEYKDSGPSVHIERQSDQQAFLKEWEGVFRWFPFPDVPKHRLEGLAVIHGALPYEPRLNDWLGYHAGSRFKNYLNNPYQEAATFDIAEIEEAFVRDWVKSAQIFHYDANNDFYISRIMTIPEVEALCKWKEYYDAYKKFSFNEGKQEFVDYDPNKRDVQIKIVPRYDVARMKFEKEWGHLYKPVVAENGEIEAFVGDFPKREVRPVPQDFQEYFEGKRDLSQVKRSYLHSNHNPPPPFINTKRLSGSASNISGELPSSLESFNPV